MSVCISAGSSYDPLTGGCVSASQNPLCTSINKDVNDTKGDLPDYITDTWRWNDQSALNNDLVTAQMNLADAERISSIMNFIEAVGAAAGVREGLGGGRITIPSRAGLL